MEKVKLYQKIVAVMSEVGQLEKANDIKDKSGKKMYSYLSEEQTTGALQRAFINHGLVMFPTRVESEIVTLESFAYDKEKKTPITKVIVTYKICDTETGASEEIQSIGYGSDSQDKGSNKAMTGAFKYAQRQTFMISTGDDGDHISSAELDAKRKPQDKPQQTTEKKDYMPAIKGKWQILAGSMDGFDDFYKEQQAKGVTDYEIDLKLAKRMSKKVNGEGAA